MGGNRRSGAASPLSSLLQLSNSARSLPGHVLRNLDLSLPFAFLSPFAVSFFFFLVSFFFPSLPPRLYSFPPPFEFKAADGSQPTCRAVAMRAGAALASRRCRAERRSRGGVLALKVCGHRDIARCFSRGQKRKGGRKRAGMN